MLYICLVIHVHKEWFLLVVVKQTLVFITLCSKQCYHSPKIISAIIKMFLRSKICKVGKVSQEQNCASEGFTRHILEPVTCSGI